MIRFGPAGIPLSCKGRTLKDGIEDVHNLSLTAMEIPMVRAGTFETYPEEEDVGLTIKDLEGLVVEIIRDDESIVDPDEPIEEDDVLIRMASGIVDSFGELYEVGEMSKRLDVSVSLHTPNYIDLGSNNELTDICINSIRHAGIIVNALQGDIVVTSLGLYNGLLPREEIDDNIYGNVAAIMDWWDEVGLKPKLGVEITGQQEVFGSLDQILDICNEFDNVVPVVNFPHYHSRTEGSLLNPDDFNELIDAVMPYCKGHLHGHFAGVEHMDGNELRLTPIKKGDLKFEALAESLAEIRPNATIISSSPLLEHDAMYMRIIYERVINKKVSKILRNKKKEAEAAEAAGAE